MWARRDEAEAQGLVDGCAIVRCNRAAEGCYANAQMESPAHGWSAQPQALDTRLEVANAIFEYLEMFRDRQRRHSSLGMLSPIEYERRHAKSAVRDMICIHASSESRRYRDGRFMRSGSRVRHCQ